MAADAGSVPAWLAEVFPGCDPKGVSSCSLRKGEEGAGLDLEASELGYVVEGVDAEPGQDPLLRPGALIVAIDGRPLVGLDEDALSEAFGEVVQHGSALLVASAEQLRAASQGQRLQGRVLHIALSRPCDEDLAKALAGDLATFASRFGVVAELVGRPASGVVLSGPREQIVGARPEFSALLAYHKLGGTARGQKRAAEAEVAMQSLPARNRRRRSAAAMEEEAAEEQAAEAAAEAAAQALASESAKAEGDAAPAPKASEAGPTGAELSQYEYMDHTADVVLHSWGTSLREAIAQVCVCFFSYMTDLDKLDTVTTVDVEATGHDMLDMLYHLLDEFLFAFGTSYVMCRRVEVVEFDETNLRIKARGWGEKFDLAKHPQGTEIKAITMHQMKILTPTTLTTEEGTVQRTSDLMEGGAMKDGFPFECYVLVDI